MKLKIIFLYITSVLVAVTLQGCPGSSPIPLASHLGGRWEWIKTQTPTQIITPQTAGYQQEMNFSNDGNNDYVAFFRNDTLQRKLIQSRTPIKTDNKNNSVLLLYGNNGYIKYFIKFSQDNSTRELETSELLPEYTKEADTVRHFYKYVGVPR